MEKPQPFHLQLKRERERRGWSQEDLASKINCDVKSVRRWERGERPSPYYRQKLFELFDKDAETFGLLEDTQEDTPQIFPALVPGIQEDWGEAPDVVSFYGRERERRVLEKWITEERCRVVAVLGLGGIGKTTFATYVAQQVKSHFTHVFWRSLRNAPSLQHILKQCIHFVSNREYPDLPQELDEQISLLMRYLQERRCLIILDNIESILQAGERAGQYAKGYEAYGSLIRRMGETRHQSCLMLTSREKPEDVAHIEGKASRVRSFSLSGVGQSEGRAILQDRELIGSDEQWAALVQLYSGNPLALQLVAEPIHAAFGGEIASFLQEEKTVVWDITELLEQQFHRLSAQEQEILTWLAIEREAVSLEEIRANLVHPVAQEVVHDGLASLRRRSLIETRSSTTFTLQPVIMEYVTGHLVQRACSELDAEMTGTWTGVGGGVGSGVGAHGGVWANYAFIKAQVKDYVRDIQLRFILSPIAERLLDTLGQEGVEEGIKTMVATQQRFPPQQRNYTAGNALNLLAYIHSDLRGADFSHLTIRQAYLQNVPLPEVNFAHARFVASTFTNTFGNVLSVTFSPQGDRLVAGTAGGDMWVYEALTGTPLHTYHGHSDGVWAVAFRPDGRLLASGSDDWTICLWHTDTGGRNESRPYAILRDHANRVRAVTFSPDGRLLASGSDDFTVRLWAVGAVGTEGHNDLHPQAVLQGHTDRVWAVAFSPDGRLLASGSTDQSVRVWDISTGTCLKVLRGHTNWIRSVAFSPDGQTLASGSDDKSIRLWDIQTGRAIRVLSGHTNRVWSVAFSAEGSTLASSSEDQSIRLWDSSTGLCLKTLSGHAHGVRSVAFSPDRIPASGIPPFLASGGDDQTVRVWDINTGYCLRTLQGYTNRIWSVAFSPSRTLARDIPPFLASSSEDQAIRLWDIASGTCFRVLQDRRHGVRAIALSPDMCTLASGGEDDTVRLWDITTGDCAKILLGHTNWVRTVVFNHDGSLLASGSEDQTIRLWNVATGDCLTILKGHTSLVRTIAFSPDGHLLASGGDDQTIRLWDVATGLCLRILQEHSGHIRAVAFSPDGCMVASGSEDKTIRLWNAETGDCRAVLQGHTNWVRSVAFSPDGRLLASSSDDQTICLWEIAAQEDKRAMKILQGHSNRIRWVAFSPDGQTLASSSDDGTIKLWDSHTSTCLKTLINERPYERMNIAHAQGLTSAQKATLRALGAIEA